MRYEKQLRKITRNGQVSEKYVAKIHREGTVSLDKLAEEIEYQTSATKGDVLLVLQAMEDNIKRHLTDGETVKLGILGTFYPCLSSKSVDKADDVSADIITRVSCTFTPSKNLRIALGDSKLSAVDKEIHLPKENRYSGKEPVKRRKKPYKR